MRKFCLWIDLGGTQYACRMYHSFNKFCMSTWSVILFKNGDHLKISNQIKTFLRTALGKFCLSVNLTKISTAFIKQLES